ncbi:Diphthamide biosynthesis protein 4 [Phytophthora boehmeriae]|uniref:Diphthamide biosynthesis protein 4 n=1 Tax=Phytophthora boehmeriae TaxID=109152 RepID=A0A8T1WN02_9STRA|nr:Diphthamide biosynthesis protein 4 [Phytophthora boehmeriae]
MAACLYDVLGVAVDCSADDIRRAYHQAARKYHPDKRTAATNGSDADGSSAHDEQQFLQVQEAYETLRNTELRQQYDAKVKQDALNRKREEEVVVVSDTVALADMQREVLEGEKDEDDEVLFTHECRCGDLYEISEDQLLDGADVVPCTGCSLHIRVVRHHS